ncbi:MAG: hypothetical protein ACI4SG_04185 [Oligosphaeraceae bacterium]
MKVAMEAKERTSLWSRGGSALAFLGLLSLLLTACGKNGASSETTAPSLREEPASSRREMRCASPVDGTPMTARLHFPPGYDNAHRRPLILVLPGVAFPDSPPMGEAMVARLLSWRPAGGGCPESVLWEDWGRMLEYLLDNLPAERQRVYLVGQGRSGVGFACRHALELTGGRLSFPDGAPEEEFSLEEFPVCNLTNLPLWLELPASGASQGGRALKEYLETREDARVNAPVRLLESPEEQRSLLEAFTWLSQQRDNPDSLVWEWRMGEPFPAWWLTAQRRQGQGESCFLSVQRKQEQGCSRLQIHTRGISRLALQTNEAGFARGKPIVFQVDDVRMGLSPQRGWVAWEREGEGEASWRLEGTQDPPVLCPEQEWATLQSFLTRPAVLVVGTSVPEHAAFWEAAAQWFSQEWERRTGTPIPIRQDTGVTAADMRERRLILLGNVEENRLAEELLAQNPSFLRRLFQKLENDERTGENTLALTLCPADSLLPGTLALLAVANAPEAIPRVLPYLLQKETQQGQFLLATPQRTLHGRFSRDWKIP